MVLTVTIKYQISFKANLHLSWYFVLKLKQLISPSHLVSNLSSAKMSTLPTLCITGKRDGGQRSQSAMYEGVVDTFWCMKKLR